MNRYYLGLAIISLCLIASLPLIAQPGADLTEATLTYKNSAYKAAYNNATKRLACSSENPGAVWQATVADNVPAIDQVAARATAGGPIFLYSQQVGGQAFVQFSMLHFRTGQTRVPLSGESLKGTIGRGSLQSATFGVGPYGAEVTVIAIDGNTRYTYRWDINIHGTSKQLADPVAVQLPGGTGTTPTTPTTPTIPPMPTTPPTPTTRTITTGSAGNVSLSIIFLVDCSGSMRGSKMESAKQAVVNSVNQTNDGKTEWALLGFGGACTCWEVVPFTTDASKLQSAVGSLVADGGTPLTYSIYKATTYLVKNGHGANGRLVVLCDGDNSCDQRQGGGRTEAAAGLRTVITSHNIAGGDRQP